MNVVKREKLVKVVQLHIRQFPNIKLPFRADNSYTNKLQDYMHNGIGNMEDLTNELAWTLGFDIIEGA